MSTELSSSASFDAYVIYLYIVLGHPAKEIAEHQGISKDDVAEILRHYGFNFKNTYGAGQHFKAYPTGKSFKLRNGQTISLEISQDFVESYVNSGSFYDNSFEDFINRYFTPASKGTKPPEPEAEDTPAPEKSPALKAREKRPLSPKMRAFLKILAGIAIAGLVLLLVNCAGCFKIPEISCAGYAPQTGGNGEAEMFDLLFSTTEDWDKSTETTVLLDGIECGKPDFSVSENCTLPVKKTSGPHVVEVVAGGEKSNPLFVDMEANSKMYIVISPDEEKPHISMKGECTE